MVAVAYVIPEVVVSRACEVGEPWMALHQHLLSIARRRAALDSEELGAIREAIRVQLWRRFGMTSLREYLEHFMGHGPRVAAERIRVTEALEALPAIEDALATGEVSYSAVRELTRIATPRTEEAWLQACAGKNLRQIEELVAEREHGDAPTDDPKPDVRPQRVVMTLRPSARAALRAARQAIEAARGERIDDSELIEELCRGYASSESHEGPRAQIAITKCETCAQAWQHAAGRKIAITEAEYETAACDARFIGSLDAPQRPKSAVPAATDRAVKQRDSYRCTVPGCRSARLLHAHHIVWQSRGGGHEMENLTLLCAGHHGAVHRGEIVITGKAPAIVVTRKFEVPHVGDPASAIANAEAIRACARASGEVPHVGEPASEIANAEDIREWARASGEVPHVGDLESASAGAEHVRTRAAGAQRIPHVGDLASRDAARDALLALTRLGFTKAVASRAVAAALDEEPETLEQLVRGALRHCPKPTS